MAMEIALTLTTLPSKQHRSSLSSRKTTEEAMQGIITREKEEIVEEAREITQQELKNLLRWKNYQQYSMNNRLKSRTERELPRFTSKRIPSNPFYKTKKLSNGSRRLFSK